MKGFLCPNNLRLSPSSTFGSSGARLKATSKQYEGLQQYIMAGSRTKRSGCSNYPYVENVGLAKKIIQHDGKATVLIVPAMLQRVSRAKFSIARSKTKIESAFSKGLPMLTEECLKSSEYYFEDGLRKVKPYFVVRGTKVKCEKPMSLMEYLLKYTIPKSVSGQYKIISEMTTFNINMRPAKLEDTVTYGDYVSNFVHFHERAVFDEKIDIIHEDEDILVVNKPATLAMYPQGETRLNSLNFILVKEYGYKDIRNTHRLDKNTSGVCILGKNYFGSSKVVKMFQNKAKANNIKKTYLTKVEGKFPPEEFVCNHPLTTNFYGKVDEVLEDKPSVTKFQRLEYCPITDTSLVQCIPLTGRTHQIRRHLLHLGHPVINDYVYNQFDEKRRHIVDANLFEQAKNRMLEKHANRTSNAIPWNTDLNNTDWIKKLSDNYKFSSKNPDLCIPCELGEDFMRNFEKQSLMHMCLHALSYEIDGVKYETPLPKWITDTDYYLESIIKPRQSYSGG